MGFTKTTTSSDGYSMVIGMDVSRKEAIETIKGWAGSSPNTPSAGLTPALSYMFAMSSKEPCLNPSNIKLEVGVPYSSKGLLPLSQKVYDIIKLNDRPIIHGKDHQLLYGFSPGLYYHMVIDAIEDIPGKSGKFEPTSVTPNKPNLDYTFYKVINYVPFSIADPHFVAAGGPLVPKVEDEFFYPFQILDMLATVGMLEEYITTEQAIWAKDALRQGALIGIYSLKAMPDMRRILLNPMPYVMAFIKAANAYYKDAKSSQAKSTEEATYIANSIGEAWADFTATLLDMNLSPDILFILSPQYATLKYPKKESILYKLSLNLIDAIQHAKSPGQVKTILSSYQTLEFAVVSDVIFDAISYLNLTFDNLAKATKGSDNKVYTFANDMIAQINTIMNFYQSLPITPKEAENAINSGYSSLLSGKYAYNLDVPAMSIMTAKAANVFRIPGKSLYMDKAVFQFTGYASKSWIVQKIQKHQTISSITQLDRIVTDSYDGALNEAIKSAQLFADILASTNRFVITDDSYVVQINGKEYTLHGPSGIVADNGTYYSLISFIPVSNPCPFTNVFKYSFENGTYKLTPLNPIDPSAPYTPKQGCSKVLLTADEVMSMYGFSASAIAEYASPQLIGLLDVAIIVGAIALGAFIASEFMGNSKRYTQAYNSTIKVYGEAEANIGNGIQAEKEALNVNDDIANDLTLIIDQYLKNNPNDPANKQMVDKYLNILGDVTGNTSQAEKYINNGMNASAQVSKDVTESWNKFVEGWEKTLSFLSPSNLTKYLLLGGAVLVGIEVLPAIITNAITSGMNNSRR